MANYYGATRTNYCNVTDLEAFKRLLNDCMTTDGLGLTFISNEDKVGFYVESSLIGIPLAPETDNQGDDSDEDCQGASLDLFHEKLQTLVAPGDAIIITEVGREKMRYLVGDVTVITRNEIRYMNLRDSAIAMAQDMLGNPSFKTVNEY